MWSGNLYENSSPHKALLCVRAYDTWIFLWWLLQYLKGPIYFESFSTDNHKRLMNWHSTLNFIIEYDNLYTCQTHSADLHALIVIIIASIINEYINWHFDTWINTLLLIKSVCNSFVACIFHECSLLQLIGYAAKMPFYPMELIMLRMVIEYICSFKMVFEPNLIKIISIFLMLMKYEGKMNSPTCWCIYLKCFDLHMYAKITVEFTESVKSHEVHVSQKIHSG